MRIPIELLIEQDERRRRDHSDREQRVWLELPMPTGHELPETEDEDSDRGVTIISIWD